MSCSTISFCLINTFAKLIVPSFVSLNYVQVVADPLRKATTDKIVSIIWLEWSKYKVLLQSTCSIIIILSLCVNGYASFLTSKFVTPWWFCLILINQLSFTGITLDGFFFCLTEEHSHSEVTSLSAFHSSHYLPLPEAFNSFCAPRTALFLVSLCKSHYISCQIYLHGTQCKLQCRS